MEQKIAVRNAGMAVLQVIVSGGILFALFYVLLRAIGAAQFGVWALVLATVSATRVSELGLSGGVVKFVAKHLAEVRPQVSRRDYSNCGCVYCSTSVVRGNWRCKWFRTCSKFRQRSSRR
jgi:O-antigen/teichoic acid export membrane protein